MGKDNPIVNAVRSDGEDIALAGEQGVKAAKRAFLSREQYLRILAILIALVITAVIFIFRDRVVNLEGYGYLGAFLVSLISAATIILPIPGIVVIFALGATFNPFLIGVVAGAGSSLGELTGYMAGYSGQGVLQNSKIYLRMERWMRQRGSILIFVLSFVPNPIFDLAGVAAGVLRFPLWKFLAACFLGKTPRNILVALGGAWAVPWMLEFIERFF